MKRLKSYILFLLFSFMVVPSIMAQGNNHGLGNENETELNSLSNRIFKLESRIKPFQVYLNLRAGFSESFDGDDKGGRFMAHHIRPEFLGEIGKWGYRLRLNLGKDHAFRIFDNTNDVIDILNLYFNPTKKWAFTLGKTPLNYGSFEYDWNPVHVLQYFEFQNCQPDMNNYSVTAGFTPIKGHTFTVEVANASSRDFEDRYNEDIHQLFEESTHPFQYSFSWRGKMFKGKLNTIWSYTLRNEARRCNTHLVMLGTNYKIGKVNIYFDYNGAFGNLDYLGVATLDAVCADLIEEDDVVRDTRYSQFTLDVGYRPTPRWEMFVKAGANISSSSEMDVLNSYRTTCEYMAAVQYFLDKSQDLRLSLSYHGSSIFYKKDIGLPNYNTNKLELSVLCRLKLL